MVPFCSMAFVPRLPDDAWMNPPQALLQSHPAGIDQLQTIA
jgi:hypothetical protein